jgi:uncharacterized damage-inducible protein DinB
MIGARSEQRVATDRCAASRLGTTASLASRTMSDTTPSLLRDLLAHREWADAEQLRALAQHQPAAVDPTILKRWHHMIAVQRTFLWAAGGLPQYEMPDLATFDSLASLATYGRTGHGLERAYVNTLTSRQLREEVVIPFFQNPTLSVSRSEALAQSVMHSQHHRAQNATRLRELGGVPPTTDLIIWYWQGRPAARWDIDP